MNHFKRDPEKGFTLVELAIVMLIIGLLIGGILKGQEMLNNSRLTRVIADFKSYNAAYISFDDKYNARPGDMVNADTRLPNCTGANFCVNGDGDRRIGDPADPYNVNQAGSNALPDVETSMFWKHLVLAGFISGVTENADPTAPAFGLTHPVNPVAGGYQVGHNSGPAGSPNRDKSSNMIYTVGRLNGGINTQTTLTVHQAIVLDQKLDDGQPNTGVIYAEQASSGCKDGDNMTQGWTMANLESPVCIVFYFLD